MTKSVFYYFENICTNILNIFCKYSPWGQCYKTFFVRDLQHMVKLIQWSSLQVLWNQRLIDPIINSCTATPRKLYSLRIERVIVAHKWDL